MVKTCFMCGKTENETLLFETITSEGVQNICRKCGFDVDLPLIKRPSQERLKESQIKKSVYGRLSDTAGLDIEEHQAKLLAIERKRNEIMSKQDYDLKEIVNKNLGNLKKEESEKFIDNFHWIIMRSRRLKKITQKELAKSIGEPEESIKMLEKGFLPRGNELIVKKIENYLGLNIFKKNVEQPKETCVEIDKMKIEFVKKIEEEPKELFDRKNPNQLVISDLKEIKDSFKQNPKIFEKKSEPTLMIQGEEIGLGEKKVNVEEEPEFIQNEKDFIGKPAEEKEEKKDLTDEEITDLIFGKGEPNNL